MKKKLLLILLFALSSLTVISNIYKKEAIIKQSNTFTYLVTTPIYTEDFEGTHNWVFVNGAQTNKWFVGSAVNNGGTKSLYISDNNGVDNQYDTTGMSTTHAYKDIVIPTGTADVELSFD